MILVIAVQFVYLMLANPAFEWGVVVQYLVAPQILRGVGITLMLSGIAMAIGIVGGVIMAVCRLSSNVVLSSAAGAFIWFFRGVPVLVQLIFWYNLAALIPKISIAIPFGPELVSWNTNDLISPISAAILGFGLNEIALMAEIVRGGILSVDLGQGETASALGMRKTRTLARIIVPQAMRFIVPPTGNQVISIVKATSLVSVIALSDILYTVQTIYNFNYKTIPLLVVASLWYLFTTSVLTVGQSFIERYYARGATRNAQIPLAEQFMAALVRPKLLFRSWRSR